MMIFVYKKTSIFHSSQAELVSAVQLYDSLTLFGNAESDTSLSIPK